MVSKRMRFLKDTQTQVWNFQNVLMSVCYKLYDRIKTLQKWRHDYEN